MSAATTCSSFPFCETELRSSMIHTSIAWSFVAISVSHPSKFGETMAPQPRNLAAISLVAKDGVIGRQDIATKRRGKLNANGSKWFDTYSPTHHLYDLFCYVLFLLNRTSRGHLRPASFFFKTPESTYDPSHILCLPTFTATQPI